MVQVQVLSAEEAQAKKRLPPILQRWLAISLWSNVLRRHSNAWRLVSKEMLPKLMYSPRKMMLLGFPAVEASAAAGRRGLQFEEEREASRFTARQHPDGADGIGQDEDSLA